MKDFVVINTVEHATELLDRRSSIYSDRPRMIVAGEIMCDDMNVGMIHYGQRWKNMRKATHDSMHIRVVDVYQQEQMRDAVTFLDHLLDSPDKWQHHVREVTTSMSLSVTYGQHLATENSYDMVKRVSRIVEIIATAASPATAPLVEVFPVLERAPEWLAGWKRKAREIQRESSAMYEDFLGDVSERMHRGVATRSLATSLLENTSKYNLSFAEAASLCGTVFVTGQETTGGAVETFILAMVLYPNVLKCAQSELDTVVGRDRLPTFEDQTNLPYIDAIVKEVIRWRSGVPLGIPRRCEQDDWYNGYLIPKGTNVIFNVWGMSRDAQVFKDPEEFIPERHLKDGQNVGRLTQTDVQYAFGFGRRICPGRNIAYQSLFIIMASMIWACDMRKKKDAAGEDIVPSSSARVHEGIVLRPAPFVCDIVPRHEGVASVIAQAKHSTQ